VFGQIDKVDRTFLMINVFFLMAIAFVPFPTILVAEHLRDPGLGVAALAYGFTFTITAVFYNLQWLYAGGPRRLLRDDADPRVSSNTRSHLPGPWIYLGATLVAVEADGEDGVVCGDRRLLHARERVVRSSEGRPLRTGLRS
jgi:hypothetical protein